MPVTCVGVWAVLPMYGVTVYRVIGLPPSVGALQVTTAVVLPGAADTLVGAVGAVAAAGTTGSDGAEAGPVPTALVADTRNVYAVPFVSPVTVTPVTGGLPLTVVGVWAVLPMNGVTV